MWEKCSIKIFNIVFFIINIHLFKFLILT
jgi:hypothetical protein